VSEVVAAAPEVAAIPEEYLYIYTVLELWISRKSSISTYDFLDLISKLGKFESKYGQIWASNFKRWFSQTVNSYELKILQSLNYLWFLSMFPESFETLIF
jgi:hypothetical protein